jgi:hypothetical protein
MFNPVKYDLRLSYGQARTLTFTMNDEDGAPFDITGYTFTLKVYSTTQAGAPTVAFTKTVGSGITLSTQSGATLGQLTVALSSTNMGTNVEAGTYKWELSYTVSGGTDVIPLVEASNFVVVPTYASV